MDPKDDKPYFAPQAEGAAPEGEVPKWGEDAAAIAREAGLGSYGPEPTAQEAREEALLRNLDRIDGEVAGLRGIVFALCAVVLVVVGLVIWALAR
jgi:hypothetical protein